MVSTRRLCPCAWTGAARIGGAQHSYRHWRAAAPQSTRRGALSDAARPPVSSSGVGVYDTVEPPARCRAPAVNGKRYATDAVRPLATFSPWLRVWREKGREERRRQPPETIVLHEPQSGRGICCRSGRRRTSVTSAPTVGPCRNRRENGKRSVRWRRRRRHGAPAVAIGQWCSCVAGTSVRVFVQLLRCG